MADSPYARKLAECRWTCKAFALSLHYRQLPMNPKDKQSCITSPEYGFREPCYGALKHEYLFLVTTSAIICLFVVVGQSQLTLTWRAYHSITTFLAEQESLEAPPLGTHHPGETNPNPIVTIDSPEVGRGRIALPPGWALCYPSPDGGYLPVTAGEALGPLSVERPECDHRSDESAGEGEERGATQDDHQIVAAWENKTSKPHIWTDEEMELLCALYRIDPKIAPTRFVEMQATFTVPQVVSKIKKMKAKAAKE
ncbi:hypothetical protein HKX48_005901 [Thoreauomyces humboldtii]|nr:hypothetical protein HKX48_005901 [Thoreauomyces humboldtii]